MCIEQNSKETRTPRDFVDEAILRAMTEAIVDAIDPDEVILFGSQAKDAAHEGSDVDLLVIVPDTPYIVRHRSAETGRLYRSLKRFRVSKDILLYTRSEAEHWRNTAGHVVASGYAEGRLLYERQ